MLTREALRLLGVLSTLGPLAAAFWQPSPGTSWYIKLDNPINSLSGIDQFEAYDFDVFDNTANLVSQVHNLPQNAKAICYFSAGSYENWRPDAKEFKKKDLGKPLDGWPGERWINISSPDIRTIMAARMDMAQRKGCDALDPDNVDGYTNNNGLGLTKADATNYVQWLASEGHKRGMAVGLKNAGGLIPAVIDDVEFQVNEQCVKYHECNTFQPFIKDDKPVFHIEYQKSNTVTAADKTKFCDNPGAKGFDTVIKHLNLDAWYYSCPPDGAKKQDGTNKPKVSKDVPSIAAREARPWNFFRF